MPVRHNFQRKAPALLIALLLMCWSDVAMTQEGFLFYPDFTKESGGTRPPLRIYEAGSGREVKVTPGESSLRPGTQYALPPGDYHVEVGRFETPERRFLYRIEAQKLTTVAVGAVTISFPCKAADLEICPAWGHNLTLYIKGKGAYVPIASDIAMDTVRYGYVQLHAGKYLLEWNKFHHSVEIEAGKLLKIEPVRVAPFEGFTKPRVEEAQREGLEKPGAISPCVHRPLYFFPGEYSLSYRVKTNSYPFFRVATEPMTIEANDKFLKTKKLPRLKGKARRYRGKRGVGEPAASPPADAPVEKSDEQEPETRLQPDEGSRK